MAADNKPKPKNASGAPPAARSQPKQDKLFEHDHELVAARFSPCGKFLFAGSYDGNAYRWALADGVKTTLRGHHGWLQGLAFHPDGHRLFTGDSWGGLCCWSYADVSRQPIWTRTDAHSRWMQSLAVSPDGALLATCGADRVVRLWNSVDGSPAWESPPQPDDLLCVAFHPDGKALVAGDLKGSAIHWDLAGHKAIRQLDAKVLYLRPNVSGVQEINDVGGIRSFAFDTTGTLLICAGSQPITSGFFTGKPTIVLIDWASGQRKQVLQWEGVDPSEGITLDVAWHPDGYLLAASSGPAGERGILLLATGRSGAIAARQEAGSLSQRERSPRWAASCTDPGTRAGGAIRWQWPKGIQGRRILGLRRANLPAGTRPCMSCAQRAPRMAGPPKSVLSPSAGTLGEGRGGGSAQPVPLL